MTLAELKSLGAPDLPPGYYYHVRSNGWGMVFVAIMRERKYLWDKCVSEVTGSRYSREDANEKISPELCIRNAAEDAYKSVFKTKPAERTWWDDFRYYEGDHK